MATTEVTIARRAYFQAERIRRKATDRHERFGADFTAKALAEAKSAARLAYADYRDACATAGVSA